MLNNKFIKTVKLLTNIYGIVWSLLLIACCIIFIQIPRWYQEPILFWPFVHSFFTYISIYKLHYMLKVQHNTLSYLDLKIWLLSFCKGVFLSLLYASLAARYLAGAILFFILATSAMYCQNYLKKQKTQ